MLTTLLLAAGTGFVSTLHCWGMCGGIVAALALGAPAGVRTRGGAVALQLSTVDDQLQIEVVDNGPGLRGMDGVGRQGLGLRGMRERAEACGGRLEVGDSSGGGCVIVAWLPLTGAAGACGRGVTGEVN